MRLTEHEQERLMITYAADVAQRRRERGLRLNYPEAVALITAFVLEGAREGRSVAELMSAGRSVLAAEDVMAGVAEMVESVQVEATFPDGTKLVTVHGPIPTGPSAGIVPGEIIAAPGTIELNPGRERVELLVENTGDRPIQVGSHYHFAQTNPELTFDRAAATGFRLDIPAGTSVRFEPGMSQQVTLVRLAGRQVVPGLRND